MFMWLMYCNFQLHCNASQGKKMRESEHNFENSWKKYLLSWGYEITTYKLQRKIETEGKIKKKCECENTSHSHWFYLDPVLHHSPIIFNFHDAWSLFFPFGVDCRQAIFLFSSCPSDAHQIHHHQGIKTGCSEAMARMHNHQFA